MDNNPEKDKEKLERICQKLKNEGDISPLEADFAAEVQLRYWRKEADKLDGNKQYWTEDSESWGKRGGLLHRFYSEILKKLENGEDGNFVCAIPLMNYYFLQRPKGDEVFPIIKTCYKLLKKEHVITSIDFSNSSENTRMLEKYFGIFGNYDFLHKTKIEFKTCGRACRAGIPIEKMMCIPTKAPNYVFSVYNTLNIEPWEDTIISEIPERKPEIFCETVTAAVLKNMEIPALWLVTYRFKQNVMIPKDMEILHTLEIIRQEFDLVSMWKKKFRDRFTTKGDLEKFADIVLRESKYIRKVRAEKQHVDDEFLEMTL